MIPSFNIKKECSNVATELSKKTSSKLKFREHLWWKIGDLRCQWSLYYQSKQMHYYGEIPQTGNVMIPGCLMWILFGGPTPIHLFPATTGHSASQNARPGTNSTGFRFHRKGVASASWRTPAWVGHDLHGGNQGKNGDIFLENEHALKKRDHFKRQFLLSNIDFQGVC